MNREAILVLGGTGKTGRRVAAQLKDQGLPVRIGSRSGQPRFDWLDETTWAPALEGVSAAYVVTAGVAPPMHRLNDLAVAQRVERLVLLSARAWQHVGDQDLLETEHQVKASGGPWTILRPTWFAQNFTEEPFLSALVRQGAVKLSTSHGLVPFVDAEDIAAVAVAALTQPGHVGQTYELSGPRMLTFGEAVDEIARFTGQDLSYVAASPEEVAAHLEPLGFPREFTAFLNRMFGWVDEGMEAYLSHGVQTVLGRQPRDFADYVRSASWDK